MWSRSFGLASLVKLAFLIKRNGKQNTSLSFFKWQGTASETAICQLSQKKLHNSASFTELKNYCPHNYSIFRIINKIKKSQSARLYCGGNSVPEEKISRSVILFWEPCCFFLNSVLKLFVPDILFFSYDFHAASKRTKRMPQIIE